MNVQCHSCIGGTNIGEDIRKLDYGQHVVSGTPGRVFGKILFKCSVSVISNKNKHPGYLFVSIHYTFNVLKFLTILLLVLKS